MTKPTIERAKYGAAAFAGLQGLLPNKFPRRIGPNALRYLQEVIDSGLTVDMIGRFEQAFAGAMGVKHCIATPGCTNALMLLAEAMRFNPGDEIICSPITDYGTIMGIIKKDFIPVFADTEPGSPNLSVRTIESCLTDRTRAILCVHKTGTLCDMDPIMDLARRHNLMVVEDACQAVYGRYKGRLAGTIGHVAAFSFDSEKTMGSDVGGCLITNDDQFAEYARFVGQSRGAEAKPVFGRLHTVAGQALRMPHCTAAVSLAQLEIIEEQVTHIDRMIRLLTQLLAEIPGIIPTPIPDYMGVYSCWMAGFSIDPEAFKINADEFGAQCAKEGLTGAGTARYYLMPAACTFLEENARNGVFPYSQPPASRTYRYRAEECPNAQAFLNQWIRWSTFSDKYQPEHCELAARIVRNVADANRV
jgi:perosamine synthetase